jgi:hypothetical protein
MGLNLEERVSRLEDSLRRWRLVSLLAGLGLLGVLAVAATPVDKAPVDELKARKLSIMSPEGDAFVVIEAKKGGSHIAMASKDRKSLASIGCDDAGAALILSKGEKPNESVGTLIAGDMCIVSCETSGLGSFTAGASAQDQRGVIELKDASGKMVWSQKK